MTRALPAILALFCCPLSSAAQDGGSDWARIAGGTLGLYSGAVLGLGGGLIPCGQTYDGVSCARASAMAGGVFGLVSGMYLGGVDERAVEEALRGAGYGALAGSAAGLALALIVPHYNALDVATAGALGAGIGASAEGAAIGLAAGTLAGAILWGVVPSLELADAVGVALLGMALGGLSGWVARGLEDDADAQELVMSINLKL
jgi:hypothetical protein